MAPIAPFFAEWLYGNLNAVSQKETHQSVHLSLYPLAEESFINLDLEQRMSYAQRITSLVLSLRKKEKIRVRQPLQKILLPVLDQKFEDQVKAVEDLILHEVNVKKIEYIQDASGVIKKKIKPNFKTLGRILGKHMKAASQIIMNLTQDNIAEIESSGNFTLTIEGQSFDLTLADFEITAQEIPGWQVAQDGDITVALDINLNPELLAEGMAREIVKGIQGIRKDSDLEVTDKISVQIEKHDAIEAAISTFGDYVKAEVLAVGIESVSSLASDKAIDLPDGLNLKVQIEKV